MLRGILGAAVAALAVAMAALPAEAQALGGSDQDARLLGVAWKSWTPRQDPWDGISGIWEFDKPKLLEGWHVEPAAALILDYDQRFLVLDFSLTRAGKITLEKGAGMRAALESDIRANRFWAKRLLTDVTLMVRLKNQAAKQRKKIMAYGPIAAHPLAVLSSTEWIGRLKKIWAEEKNEPDEDEDDDEEPDRYGPP